MKYILVKNRHKHNAINKLPALFDSCESEQVFDFDYHKKVIHNKLGNITNDTVHVYITGLTPLIISLINYCHMMQIPLVMYHYDTSTDSYRAQTVI